MKRQIRELFGDIKKIRQKGSFVQNLAFLSSSKVFYMLLGFVFTPILTRIYSPEAYGIFTQFFAYASILSVVVPLSLNIALVLPEKEEMFLGLVKSVLASTILISLFFTGFLIINRHFQFYETLELPEYEWLIVLSAVFAGINHVLTGWNVRKKNFKEVSVWNSANGLANKIFNVLLGLLSNGFLGGILVSHIVLQFQNMVAGMKILGLKELRKVSFSANAREALREYKKYPLTVFPSQLLVRWVDKFPVIFLGPVFGISILGQYGLSVSMLNIPIQVIGQSALGVVLTQKTVELRNLKLPDLAAKMEKVYVLLILLSLFGFSFLYHFAEGLFVFVFGSEWGVAGEIAKIMSIQCAFELIAVPSASIARVLKIEQTGMFFALLKLLVSGVAVAISLIENDFMIAVWIISIGSSVVRIIEVYFYGRKISLNLVKIALILIGFAVFVNTIFFMI